MQQENKLRYCARATNVRFFTRNTLSRFLALKHMLVTGAKGELDTCTLCSIDQTTAMLCSSGSKALTLVSLVLLVRNPRVRSLFVIRIESNAANVCEEQDSLWRPVAEPSWKL